MCHAEGRFALGVRGSWLSSTFTQISTLLGIQPCVAANRPHGAEVGGAVLNPLCLRWLGADALWCRGSPALPAWPQPCPWTDLTACSLHPAVAEDLVQVVASHGEGVSLGVTEAGTADLGVGHTLTVAVLDLQRGEEPEWWHRLSKVQPTTARSPRTCLGSLPACRGITLGQ